MIRNAILILASGLLLWEMKNASPLNDEPAHLASGTILVRLSDAGYFKVNPPLHKLLSGIAVEAVTNLQLPAMIHSSHYSNAVRPEFVMGDTLMDTNHSTFLHALFIARLVRIPLILLGGILIWTFLASLPESRRTLGCSLWCFAPLVLGHGWVVSADALSGVMMCGILVATQQIWKNPNYENFAISGFCWGLAIGTKFTFAPLYLAYPIITELSLLRSSGSVRSWLAKSCAQWVFHAIVALVTLCSLYFFTEVGRPIKDHDFISHEFSPFRADKLNSNTLASQALNVFAACPSPFPRAFLEGIDQQLADMGYPRGAYLMGTRLQGKLPWFFVVGYFLKEQLAVTIAIAMICIMGFIRFCRGTKRTTRWPRESVFCAMFLSCFCFLMVTQSNLVWNVRYLIPALPLIYVLIAQNLPALHVAYRNKNLDLSVPILLLVMLAEVIHVAPFHFSYISPLFGGGYRVPPALNDSNFDYEQDLFYAQSWIARHKSKLELEQCKVYGMLSGHGRRWMKEDYVPVSRIVLESAIFAKTETTMKTTEHSSRSLLIISRGFFHPEPWSVRNSTVTDEMLSGDVVELAARLLRYKPDIEITPTIAGYFLETIPNM